MPLIRRAIAVSVLTAAAAAVTAGTALAAESAPGWACEANQGTSTWNGQSYTVPMPCAAIPGGGAAAGYGAQWAQMASGGQAPVG